MKRISIVEAIKTSSIWNNTPLKKLFEYIETDVIYSEQLENQRPCYIRYGDIAYVKDLTEIKRSFSIAETGCNAEFKLCLHIRDYTWFNSFLTDSSVVYNNDAFSVNTFNIKHIESTCFYNVYAQLSHYYLFLTFFSTDMSQLITLYVKRYTENPNIAYKYTDVDNTHIEVCQITNNAKGDYVFDIQTKQFLFVPPFVSESKTIISEGSLACIQDISCFGPTYLHARASTKTRNIEVINKHYLFLYRYIDQSDDNDKYNLLDSKFFFQNLQKLCKVYDISSLQEMSETEFWCLSYHLGLSKNISKGSGERRTVKHKIIFINAVLGNTVFKKEFTLKSLHYNTLKKDYYFTHNLSLSEVLRFNFITAKEQELLLKIATMHS